MVHIKVPAMKPLASPQTRRYGMTLLAVAKTAVAQTRASARWCVPVWGNAELCSGNARRYDSERALSRGFQNGAARIVGVGTFQAAVPTDTEPGSF